MAGAGAEAETTGAGAEAETTGAGAETETTPLASFEAGADLSAVRSSS
jgi:hypothetical protein